MHQADGAMQYELVFDIDNAFPTRWGAFALGFVTIVLFVLARFAPRFLQPSEPLNTAIATVASRAPTAMTPSSIRRYVAPGFYLLGINLLALIASLGPKWRWGAGAGAIIVALASLSFASDYEAILALRRATDRQIIEGVFSHVARGTHGKDRTESFMIANRYFSYGENDAGSPFSLFSGAVTIADQQKGRVTLVGKRIVRVERQLCFSYAHCKVSNFLGVRSETEVKDGDW
jgi:hypothetical protein